MSNPGALGEPDHYSRRFTGTEDKGGIHINCGIPNQAFYLAIEGGTNRTSNLSVQGVGAANRQQIERVFYRAFVFMLPSNATFSTARAATIRQDAVGAVQRACDRHFRARHPPYIFRRPFHRPGASRTAEARPECAGATTQHRAERGGGAPALLRRGGGDLRPLGSGYLRDHRRVSTTGRHPSTTSTTRTTRRPCSSW